MTKKHWQKKAGRTSLGVICLLISALTLMPAPERYELSIYNNLPAIFWITIAILLIAGQYLTITGGRSIGMTLISATVVLIISLPWLRGYHLYLTRDALFHIGHVNYILSSGFVHNLNFYPAIHVLGSMVAHTSGLTPAKMTVFSLMFFSVFFILLGYIISSSLFDGWTGHIASGVIPVFILTSSFLNFAPWAQSFLFILFIIYLLYHFEMSPNNAKRNRFSILLLLTVIAMIFFHPLTASTVIFILTTNLIIAYYWEPSIAREGTLKGTSIRLAIICGLGLFTWAFSSWSFNRAVSRTIAALLGLGVSTATPGTTHQSHFGVIFEIVQSADPQILDIVEIGIFRYGATALPIGFAFILLVYNIIFKRERYEWHRGLVNGLMMLFILFAILTFFVPAPFGFARLLGIATIFASIAYVAEFQSSFSISDVGVWPSEGKHVAKSILLITVLLSAVITTGTVYNSTHNKRPSFHVTEMGMEGVVWLSEHRDTSLEILSLGIDPRRYHILQTGPDSEIYTESPPSHFTTRENRSSSGVEKYLVVSRAGRINYQNFYPNYKDRWKFTPADFRRLEANRNVSTIYDNGDVEGYFLERFCCNI